MKARMWRQRLSVSCAGLRPVAGGDSSQLPARALVQPFLVLLTRWGVCVNIGWGFSRPHEKSGTSL